MKKNGIATLVLAAAVFWVTNASAIGVGVGVILPTSDFGDAYDVGYGAHVVLDYPVTPLASIYADLGWQGFKGKGVDLDSAELDAPDISIFNASAGGRVGLGSFYLGAELGYYFSDDVDNEVGLTPLIGLGLGPVDVSARYKLLDDLEWFELRGSLSF